MLKIDTNHTLTYIDAIEFVARMFAVGVEDVEDRATYAALRAIPGVVESDVNGEYKVLQLNGDLQDASFEELVDYARSQGIENADDPVPPVRAEAKRPASGKMIGVSVSLYIRNRTALTTYDYNVTQVDEDMVRVELTDKHKGTNKRQQILRMIATTLADVGKFDVIHDGADYIRVFPKR